MNKILLMLAMLFSANLHAAEPYRQGFFKYGVGIFGSAKESPIEVKTISFGRQWDLNKVFIGQEEVGVWIDSRKDVGRSSSGFANISFGVHVEAGYVYVQSLWGIAGLTNTDSYLGSHIQFNQDFSIGLKDLIRKVTIGVNYKHISSAGIFMPNLGRDFATLRLGIPF